MRSTHFNKKNQNKTIQTIKNVLRGIACSVKIIVGFAISQQF